MAVITGRYGAVDFTTALSYVRSWTISYDAEELDGSNFDESSGGRSFVDGIPSWNGSFEAYYTSGNASVVPGTSGTAVFRTSATGVSDLFFGGIKLLNMTVTNPVDGLVTQSWNFRGLGLPVQTTG